MTSPPCSPSRSLSSRLRRIPSLLLPLRLSSLQPPPSPQQEESPHDLLREDPIELLSDFWVSSFSRSVSASFPNLTGYLRRFPLWVLAYQRSCAHHTGSFPPRSAIHLPHLRSLLSLRDAAVSAPSAFPWGSCSGLLIRSPADPPSTRPLSRRKMHALLASAPPPFQDRVLQELLLLLLDPVFEPKFSSRSHAFRPGRSAHTALRSIRSHFAGYLWFIKVDLRAITDELHPDVILECFEKVVQDRKVLGLIKSALKTLVRAGAKDADEVLDGLTKKRLKRKVIRARRKKVALKENEPKPDPYWLRTFFNFAPEEAARVPNYGHCGILSPLLANVCLNELDCWLEDRMSKYFCPSKLDSIWKESAEDGCHNPAWPEFVPASGREKTRRMDFVRYGSHILIGIRGPREDAVEIRKEIMEFCESKYSIRLENSKIEIEHITRGIEFLDHIICRRVIHPTLRYTATGGTIVSQKGVGTLLSVTASLQRCIKQFRKLNLVKGDKDPEPLPCTPMLYSGQAHTNAQMNKFLETMADWYRYADNRKKVVGFCAYVIRSSVAKLYAARYRLKSRAKVYKIATRDLSGPLREFTRNNAPEYSDLLRMGVVEAIDGIRFSHMSLIPSCDYTPFPRNWIPDHERLFREYIKLQDPGFFYELYKSVKQMDLTTPQEDISKIVCDFKLCGVRGKNSPENIKQLGQTDEADTANKISATG